MEDTPPAAGRASPWLGRVLVLGVVACLVAAYFGHQRRSTPRPDRVLLVCVVDGSSDARVGLSGRLVAAIAARLQDSGFEVATTSHGPVAESLAAAPGDLVRAGAAVRARWRIEVEVRFTETRTGVPGDYVELHGAGSVRLSSATAPRSDAPRLFAAWGGSRQASVTRAKLVSGPLGTRAASLVVTALAAEGPSSAAESPAGAAMARARQETRAEAAAALTQQAERVRRNAGARGAATTYHGPFDRQMRVWGAGPLGALVWNTWPESPAADALVADSQAQSVQWHAPGGPVRKVWTGPRLYGPPAASRDGGVVAFSEAVYGWARTITVVDAAGLRRLVTAPTETFTAVSPSPRGRWVAAYARACAKCARRLVIHDAREGGVVLSLNDEGGAFGGFAWGDEGALLVLHEPASAPRPDGGTPPRFPGTEQGLWRVDIAQPSTPSRRVFNASKGRRYTAVVHGRGHAALVPRAGSGRGLMVVPLAGGAPAFIATAHRASAPCFSPDGRHLVFDLHFGGDAELATVPIAGGEVRMLTENGTDDLRPVFAVDGRHVFYQASEGQSRGAGQGVSALASLRWPPAAAAP